MPAHNRLRTLFLVLIGAGCLGALALLYVGERVGARFVPPPLPLLPNAARYHPWPTPPVARSFDYPLLPAHAYGPCMQPGVVDTRYGARNPALGDRSNCFRDVAGGLVPFSRLYHAGIDLFALDEAGQIAWGKAAHAPVRAVADGVVVAVLDAGAEGQIILVQHLLPEGTFVYSAYWHVDYVQVEAGQPVARGQAMAVVKHLGLNSHLHWEMHTFYDGSALFPAGTAGARGACNGHLAGVAYTWDDDPLRAHPDGYGYLDPAAFVAAHP